MNENFKSIPPYWYFRANTALYLADFDECNFCFDKFNEVWRPVLDYDPYKLDVTKFRIRQLLKNKTLSHEHIEKIKNLLEIVRDYAPVNDWKNNIFLGVYYFMIGEKELALACLENNIISNYETNISSFILERLKNNDTKFDLLPEFLGKLNAERFISSLHNEDLKNILTEYFKTNGYKLFNDFEALLNNKTTIHFDNEKIYFDNISQYCDANLYYR